MDKKYSKEEFFAIVEKYDKDLAHLLNGINRYQDYPNIRVGKEPEKQDVLADKQLSILLTQADITIGMKHMVEAKGLKAHFEEHYFARILALNCYEILEYHYPDIFKGLQEYKDRDETKGIMSEMDTIRQKLKIINKIHEDYLKTIRHHVIAHRHTKSGLEQNKIMWEIDPERVLKISQEIQECYMFLMILLDRLQRAIL